jgi:NhaP-type Na+/H+ and K+/H+ antiporter
MFARLNSRNCRCNFFPRFHPRKWLNAIRFLLLGLYLRGNALSQAFIWGFIQAVIMIFIALPPVFSSTPLI